MELIDKFEELKTAFVEKHKQLPTSIVINIASLNEVLYSKPFSKYVCTGAGVGVDRTQMYVSKHQKAEFKFITFNDVVHDEPAMHGGQELYFGWEK